MAKTPVTQVRTSHALTIKSNGITVGLINGWNATQSRAAAFIFEVGRDNSGVPVEIMPGNISAQTVTINRFDTYKKRMESAFGTPDLVMLTRQTEPFDVIEKWAIPDDSLLDSNESPFVDEERFLYSKCWFTNLGRTLRSDDNRVVNVNATLMYTKKLKLIGPVGEAAQFDFPSLRL